MSQQLTISRKAVTRELKENGLSRKQIKEKLYPEISHSQWKEIWDTPAEEGGLGLKNQRPSTKLNLKVIDDEPVLENNTDSTKTEDPADVHWENNVEE